MTRRTYRYDPVSKEMVEGAGPRRVDGSGDGWRFSDRLYSGTPFKAPDGTVINSKRKHREYMKRTGLTTVDDFSDTWKHEADRRAKFYESAPDTSRKEDIGRAIHGLQEKGR